MQNLKDAAPTVPAIPAIPTDIVAMDVKQDTGGIPVNQAVLVIVLNNVINTDTVLAVNQVTGVIIVPANAQSIVTEKSVTKPMGGVRRSATADGMVTNVRTPVVQDVRHQALNNSVAIAQRGV